MKKYNIVFILIFLSSCSTLFSNRDFIDEMDIEDGLFIPSKDFKIVRGDPDEKTIDWDDVWERTPLTKQERYATKLNSRLKKISNNKNKQTIEWAIQNRELVMGMPKSAVHQSWGDPSRVDIAGNPKYENERWIFYRNGQLQYVYFENGQVKGWATE